MRLAISLFAMLLFVTGCPGVAGSNSGQENGDVPGEGGVPQNNEEPDVPEIPDFPDDLPPGADTYVAVISGLPDDWSILVSLGTERGQRAVVIEEKHAPRCVF